MNADLMRNNHTQRFQEPLNFLRAIRYGCFICVPSFMLLIQNARFFQKVALNSPTIKATQHYYPSKNKLLLQHYEHNVKQTVVAKLKSVQTVVNMV